MFHYRTRRSSKSRTGVIQLARRRISTPALLISAPWGGVAGLLPAELESLGVSALFLGAYELALRPGSIVTPALGGGATLAGRLAVLASAGIDGLLRAGGAGTPARIARVTDSGIVARNQIDGDELLLSPEQSIRWQEALRPDILQALDMPANLLGSRRDSDGHFRRSVEWQKRTLDARTTDTPMLAVVDLGFDASPIADLRTAAFAGATFRLDFSPPSWERFSEAARLLAPDWARHVLIRSPLEAREAVTNGADLVESSAPARLAAAGRVWLEREVVNLWDDRWKATTEPLDANCDCPACRLSAAYLHHLVTSDELLGTLLLASHNIRTMAQAVESSAAQA